MFYRLPVHIHEREPVFNSGSYYDAFDAERILAERRELARIQAERREQERRAFLRQQLERQAAYEQAVRQRAYEEALRREYVAEQQRRAYAAAASREALKRRRAACCSSPFAEPQRRRRHHHPLFAFVDPADYMDYEEEEEPSQPVKVDIGTASDDASDPKESSESAVDQASIDEAARTLQKHFRARRDRRQALTQLASLRETFEHERSSFVPPSTLAFRPADAVSESSTASSDSALSHELTFTSSNRPVLAYEEFLVGTLSKIDAIESHGDRTVKDARKALVKSIEAELSKLDAFKEEAWRKASVETSSPAENARAPQSTEAATAVGEQTNEEVGDSAQSAPTPSSDEQPFRNEDEQDTVATSDAHPAQQQQQQNEQRKGHSEEDVHFQELAPSSSSPSSSSSSEAGDQASEQVTTSQIDAAVEQVLEAARQLGERVDSMDSDDEEDKPQHIEIQDGRDDSDGFVVV